MDPTKKDRNQDPPSKSRHPKIDLWKPTEFVNLLPKEQREKKVTDCHTPHCQDMGYTYVRDSSNAKFRACLFGALAKLPGPGSELRRPILLPGRAASKQALIHSVVSCNRLTL